MEVHRASGSARAAFRVRDIRSRWLDKGAHASRGEILDIARKYYDQGIRHVVALRGDPPQTQTCYQPHPDGFAYASDLVAGLRAVADFDTRRMAGDYQRHYLELLTQGRTTERCAS